MSESFVVSNLPEIDRQEIRRGRCPWCLTKLCDGSLYSDEDKDICPECGDEFLSVPSQRVAGVTTEEKGYA